MRNDSLSVRDRYKAYYEWIDCFHSPIISVNYRFDLYSLTHQLNSQTKGLSLYIVEKEIRKW